MKLINQHWEWAQEPPENILETIERAGRTCYRSEDKITSDSARKFVKMIVKNGHHSVLEHVSLSVKIVTNRGVTHELVRHRLASFSQESTRYVGYHGDTEFILPVWVDKNNLEDQIIFRQMCQQADNNYKKLIVLGWRPEQAREVLPNSLATTIVMTANLREWMHVFKLRCSAKAHPQIRSLMIDIRDGFRKKVPIIFD